MKILNKEKLPNGKRKIYFFGKKIFSYKTKKLSKYDKIYAKRFNGLTIKEARYILEYQFKNMAGYDLNLDNPKTFNEKIQWLKLYYRDPLMTKCADKVAVRDYIKEKIGGKYLVPIIGIYDSVDDVNFDALPNKFVMKVNWGSGQNIIVTDKSKLNVTEAKQKLLKWMKLESNHYFNFLEWAYKDIKPKIIIEEFLEQNNGYVYDYKFFCFNGEPKIMYIAVDSFDYSIMRINYYDIDFNKLDLVKHYPNTDNLLPKPKYWDQMVSFSKVLSEKFPFVRVDFFDTGKNLYVGELTFYPGNGTDAFDPMEWDYKFGEHLDLKKCKL